MLVAEAGRLRRRQRAKGTPADIDRKGPVASGVVVGAEANDADRPRQAAKAARGRSCPGSASGRVSHLVSHEGLLQVSEGGTVNEQRVVPSSVRTQQIAQSHLHAFIYLLLHNHELKGK